MRSAQQNPAFKMQEKRLGQGFIQDEESIHYKTQHLLALFAPQLQGVGAGGERGGRQVQLQAGAVLAGEDLAAAGGLVERPVEGLVFAELHVQDAAVADRIGAEAAGEHVGVQFDELDVGEGLAAIEVEGTHAVPALADGRGGVLPIKGMARAGVLRVYGLENLTVRAALDFVVADALRVGDRPVEAHAAGLDHRLQVDLPLGEGQAGAMRQEKRPDVVVVHGGGAMREVDGDAGAAIGDEALDVGEGVSAVDGGVGIVVAVAGQRIVQVLETGHHTPSGGTVVILAAEGAERHACDGDLLAVAIVGLGIPAEDGQTHVAGRVDAGAGRERPAVGVLGEVGRVQIDRSGDLGVNGVLKSDIKVKICILVDHQVLVRDGDRVMAGGRVDQAGDIDGVHRRDAAIDREETCRDDIAVVKPQTLAIERDRQAGRIAAAATEEVGFADGAAGRDGHVKRPGTRWHTGADGITAADHAAIKGAFVEAELGPSRQC